jgi:hypothetical protein
MSLSEKLVPVVLVATTVFAVYRRRREKLEPEQSRQWRK